MKTLYYSATSSFVCGDLSLPYPLLKRLGLVPAAILQLIEEKSTDSTEGWSSIFISDLSKSLRISSEILTDTLYELSYKGLIELQHSIEACRARIHPEIDEALKANFPGIHLEVAQCHLDYQGKEYIQSGVQYFAENLGLSLDDLLQLGLQPQRRKQPKPQRAPIQGYVYLLKAEGTSRYKIGVTKDMERRARTLTKQSPFPVEIEAVYFDKDIYSGEAKWHEVFDEKRVHGEWFELTEAQVTQFKLFADGKTQMEAIANA